MKLPYAEFNITNVCNLNCPDCITYNNFAFKGHQQWKDYKSVYSEWAQVLELDSLCIVGGEPMLNPDFLQWVNGIAQLWPKSEIRVLSNGTQIQHWPEYYQLLRDDRFRLSISAHGVSNRQKIYKELQQWMQAPLTVNVLPTQHELDSWQQSYNRVRDVTWPDCNSPLEFDNLPEEIKQECSIQHNIDGSAWKQTMQTWQVVDKNNVNINVNLTHKFEPCAVRYDQKTHRLTLHDSDPDKAISVCCGRFIHTFVKGSLSKCSTVALLPEFIKQLPVDLSESDNNLVNNYQSAQIDWSKERLTEFVEDIKLGKAIQQCKFCSETNETGKEFEAGVKKILFYNSSVAQR